MAPLAEVREVRGALAGAAMTDLEMTTLCAAAMRIAVRIDGDPPYLRKQEGGWRYDPLHNDRQAFELVRRFEISIAWSWTGQVGCMSKREAQQDEERRHDNISCTHTDLNRAIVECVAKMQQKAM